jgi:hypothetical protein
MIFQMPMDPNQQRKEAGQEGGEKIKEKINQ